MDGLGDRVAILGVILWATIQAHAPVSSRDKLPRVVDTVISRPWPTGRRATQGELRALKPRQGRSIGAAPFYWSIG